MKKSNRRLRKYIIGGLSLDQQNLLKEQTTLNLGAFGKGIINAPNFIPNSSSIPSSKEEVGDEEESSIKLPGVTFDPNKYGILQSLNTFASGIGNNIENAHQRQNLIQNRLTELPKINGLSQQDKYGYGFGNSFKGGGSKKENTNSKVNPPVIRINEEKKDTLLVNTDTIKYSPGSMLDFYKNRNPNSQPLDINFGPEFIPNKEKGISFMRNWYSDPATLKRASKLLGNKEEGKKLINNALKNINNVRITADPDSYDMANNKYENEVNLDNEPARNTKYNLDKKYNLSLLDYIKNGKAAITYGSYSPKGHVINIPRIDKRVLDAFPELRDKEYGTEGKYNPTIPHELTHASGLDDYLKKYIPTPFPIDLLNLKQSLGLSKFAKSQIDKEINQRFPGFNNGRYESYLQHDGFYPRVMELRYNGGLKPSDVIDEKKLKELKNIQPGNDLFQHFTDDQIINMLNNLVTNNKTPNLNTARSGGNIFGPGGAVKDNLNYQKPIISPFVIDPRTKKPVSDPAKAAALLNIPKNPGVIKKGEKKSVNPYNIVTHPFTSAQQLINKQPVTGKGPRNIYDNALDIFPAMLAARQLPQIPGNLQRGEYLNAGVNALTAIPFLPKVPKSLPKVLSKGQAYEQSPLVYQDMYPINEVYQPRTVITDGAVKNKILGLEPTPVIPLNRIEYPNTPNKFLNQTYDDFGKMESGRVNNTPPSTQESILNNLFKRNNPNPIENNPISNSFYNRHTPYMEPHSLYLPMDEKQLAKFMPKKTFENFVGNKDWTRNSSWQDFGMEMRGIMKNLALDPKNKDDVEFFRQLHLKQSDLYDANKLNTEYLPFQVKNKGYYPPVNRLGGNLNKYKEGGYLIQKGDNLTKISKKLNIPISTLVQQNNIKNPDLIYTGDTLKYSTSDQKGVKGVPKLLAPQKSVENKSILETAIPNQSVNLPKPIQIPKYPTIVDLTTRNLKPKSNIAVPKYPSIVDRTLGNLKKSTPSNISIPKYPSIIDRSTKNLPKKQEITLPKYPSIVDRGTKNLPKKDQISIPKYPSIIDISIPKNQDLRKLESGMIEDKHKNILYALQNGEVVKTFPIMTGLNKDGNISDKTLEYLESHPKEAKIFKATPVGTYFSEPEDVYRYGRKSFYMRPINAFNESAPKARGLFQHTIYGGAPKGTDGYDPEEYKKRLKIMSGPGENRVGSYGCTNLYGEDIDCLTGELFPKGDTTIVVDTRNKKDSALVSNLKYNINSIQNKKKFKDGGYMDYEDEYESNYENKYLNPAKQVINVEEESPRVTDEEIQLDTEGYDINNDYLGLFSSSSMYRPKRRMNYSSEYTGDEDWASKFRQVEDSSLQFDHGNGAFGSFGYRKSGHLQEAFKNAPEFDDLRKTYHNFDSFWNVFTSQGYGNLSNIVDQKYENWLKRQSNGDIVTAARFNLTGSKNTNKEDNGKNNMSTSGYVNKVARFRKGGIYYVDTATLANLKTKNVKFKIV